MKSTKPKITEKKCALCKELTKKEELHIHYNPGRPGEPGEYILICTNCRDKKN